MRLSTQLITPPTVEPVSLAIAKSQLRVDYTDDDTLITALITAARQYCEKYTTRAFLPQTWVRTLDFFPLYGCSESSRSPSERNTWPYGTWYWDKVTIELPNPRTLSVTSITYIGSDGTLQTLATDSYNVDLTSIPARITPAQGNFWPILNDYIPGSVKITYVAGYPTFSQVDLLEIPAGAPYSVTLSNQDVVSITSVMCNEPPPGNGIYIGPAASALTAVSSLAALASGNYYYANGVVTVMAALASTWLQVTYNTFLIPQTIIQAMLLLIGHWYNHREAVSDLPLKSVPFAVEALLEIEKVHVVEYK